MVKVLVPSHAAGMAGGFSTLVGSDGAAHSQGVRRRKFPVPDRLQASSDPTGTGSGKSFGLFGSDLDGFVREV